MAAVAALAPGTTVTRQKERPHGAERLPRPNDLDDPGTRAIGIVGLGGAAVAFELFGRH